MRFCYVFIHVRLDICKICSLLSQSQSAVLQINQNFLVRHKQAQYFNWRKHYVLFLFLCSVWILDNVVLSLYLISIEPRDKLDGRRSSSLEKIEKYLLKKCQIWYKWYQYMTMFEKNVRHISFIIILSLFSLFRTICSIK